MDINKKNGKNGHTNNEHAKHHPRCYGYKVRVTNRTSGAVILEEVDVARTFWKRLLGLLRQDSLEWGRGLIIHPCRSVHTVGMAFPIDVAFVNREGRICTMLEQMKPGRFSPKVKDALYVIEAPAGTFREVGAELHDEVALEKLPDSA